MIYDCFSIHAAYFFIYSSCTLSNVFFVFFIVSWIQCFHLRLKTHLGYSREGIGLIPIGPGGLEIMGSNCATLVDVCGWQFYPYFNAMVYKSQSSGWSDTYIRNAERIVLLYLSACPLICRWFVVVRLLWIHIILNNLIKNLDVKQPRLSSMSFVGGP